MGPSGYTWVGAQTVGMWEDQMWVSGIQSVGVISLRGPAPAQTQAGTEGGPGEQLLPMGGQRGVSWQGAPYSTTHTWQEQRVNASGWRLEMNIYYMGSSGMENRHTSRVHLSANSVICRVNGCNKIHRTKTYSDHGLWSFKTLANLLQLKLLLYLSVGWWPRLWRGGSSQFGLFPSGCHECGPSSVRPRAALSPANHNSRTHWRHPWSHPYWCKRNPLGF